MFVVHKNRTHDSPLTFLLFVRKKMERRIIVKNLWQKGWRKSEIVNHLGKSPSTVKFVRRWLKRLAEDPSITDRSRGDIPRSVRTPQLIKQKSSEWNRWNLSKKELKSMAIITAEKYSTILWRDRPKLCFRMETGAFCKTVQPRITARWTQQFYEVEFPDFIAKDEWPPNSHDLNIFDYAIFEEFEEGFAQSNTQVWTSWS